MKLFRFWKENKLDQEYTLTPDEVKAKYKEYLERKGYDWVGYYGESSVVFFVGDKEGLNSVSEELEGLKVMLWPVRKDFYIQHEATS